MSGISPFTYMPPFSDWLLILPELSLLAAIFLTLMGDLILPESRKSVLALVGLLGVIASGISLTYVANHPAGTAFYGMVSVDGMSIFAGALILFALGGGLLLSPGYLERQNLKREGEYYALIQVSALGMMLMASAGSLMLLFAGLETLSLALYVLCALPQTRLRAQEAGMKYFILSSFASAFLLYGISLTYGATGTTNLASIHSFLATHMAIQGSGFGPLLLIGMALMAVGFGFKVSAIPFQAWTPDVYSGAPTPVTAFMSVGTKVAAFVAITRVFTVTLLSQEARWQPVMWALAALTMIFGNLFAVAQRDVKRMLAYSSIANAGYILVATATGTLSATAGMLLYLAAYAVANIGAFGVVSLVESADGRGTGQTDFNGLARRNPALAAVMALFLLSLAGIPPLAGFFGKYFVFYAAVIGNQTMLAVIGVLCSVLGMYYYLRVVWAMYFVEPTATTPAVAMPAPQLVAVGANGASSAEPAPEAAALAVAKATPAPTVIAFPLSARAALAICAALTLLFIVVSGSLDTWALNAAQSILR